MISITCQAGVSVEVDEKTLRSAMPNSLSLHMADLDDYIVRDGRIMILNTRSSQAIAAAGVAGSGWNAVNRAGEAVDEGRLTGETDGSCAIA